MIIPQIMTVLPCTREANLLGCLKSRTTPDQAEYYWRLVERREVSAVQGSSDCETHQLMITPCNSMGSLFARIEK